MTHFRIRYERQGTHVKVQLFSAIHPALTHASNGNLVFTHEEWDAFCRCFQDRGIDTITILPKE